MTKYLVFLLCALLVATALPLAAGDDDSDGTPAVQAVDFQLLVPFLKSFPGWTAKGKAEGGKMTMNESSWSHATREFKAAPKKELKVAIIDGAFVPMAYAAFQALKAFSYETTEGFVKSHTLKGQPGIAQHTVKSKQWTIMLLVANRFLVTFEGKRIAGLAELQTIASTMDYAALTALGAAK